ncbi:hypothetical protein ABB37_08088 [Leptomonas pyrrhocoris]|uniref:BRCT domain-containing protein n=1 Tax=Leptomonas pyrrhocoris TaxID=157538 RepID=A0A0M9FTS1_LEPPY|nr:hypothetical protein ABB37_08088 [Leptomonas pyrrhocoris]XP_015654359.1 hypothetical protein ABB37_08088 [Leptomonas pyrrhocoris]KPA75919.1 hypothetical protein ABB37_08088 [Leptomonas pyrrhocoris]KPA75920.1 hypothetical protein ABB37_08088 [Leptomonas pyrrhocoris]|eukprot:XP_015654358.1 hypothetical protein ABB37_08088 [Leptomonas pyrrhocoris]
MSSDAQALVRQLTENPDVLESMQHMLSLLRANPPRPVLGAATESKPSTQRVRPPRTGYDDSDVLVSADQRLDRNAAAGVNHNGNYYSRHRTDDEIIGDDGKDESGASSPLPSLADVDQRGGGGGGRGRGRPPRRSSQLQQQQPQQQQQSSARSATTAVAESEELLATSKKLSDAQRRIADLEQALQRTTQRVDQLREVVDKQKGELQEAQDRHMLELEEMRHAYDAVVQRKDEVQEAALRQLMKSRQLMMSAAKYEAAVAAKKREKENHRSAAHTPSSAAAVGLTASATAVNTRNSSHLLVSGVKRERQEDAPEERHDEAKQDVYYFYNEQPPPQQPRQQALKHTTSDSWGTPARSHNSHHPYGSGTKVVYTKTESPEFITSPTPTTKSAAAMMGGGGSGGAGARTQSRSTRKRRTPRMPSLTNADRLAPTYTHQHRSSSGSAPTQRRLLPGTNSLKLDSPTPVVSTTWTAGRSLTGSRTPPPLPAPVSYAAATASMRQPQQPKSVPPSKPPLTQRAAGRLAAPQPAITRVVPNTRSGTSSVVADGPTRSPSPVDPKRGNAGPRRFIFTGLKDGEPQRLTAAIEQLADDAAVLTSELDEVPPTATTHIVLRGTPRSVKALCGVVCGKWLVSPEYILNSLESGFWLDEAEEGGMRVFPPPLQGQRFLLTVEHEGIRAKLAQVIVYGGGEVLPVYSGKVAQDVVVITSGDDLLRYATEVHV